MTKLAIASYLACKMLILQTKQLNNRGYIAACLLVVFSYILTFRC